MSYDDHPSHFSTTDKVMIAAALVIMPRYWIRFVFSMIFAGIAVFFVGAWWASRPEQTNSDLQQSFFDFWLFNVGCVLWAIGFGVGLTHCIIRSLDDNRKGGQVRAEASVYSLFTGAGIRPDEPTTGYASDESLCNYNPRYGTPPGIGVATVSQPIRATYDRNVVGKVSYAPSSRRAQRSAPFTYSTGPAGSGLSSEQEQRLADLQHQRSLRIKAIPATSSEG